MAEEQSIRAWLTSEKALTIGGEMRSAVKSISALSLGILFLVSACGGDNPPPPPPPPAQALGPAVPGNGNPGGGGLVPPPALPPNGGGNFNNSCGDGYYIEIYYDVEYCVPYRRWRGRW